MDGVVQLGPLMFAADRLLAIALLWLFLGFGTWIGRRTGTRAARAAAIGVCIGIVVSRLAYVAENRTAFAIDPWTVVAFWQGGFNWWAGVAAAALVIVILLGFQRVTVAILTLLGVLSLVHAGTGYWYAAPARPVPEGIVLTYLDGRPLPVDTLRGQPFVVNLWATWCPPCRREMPMMIDVAGSSNVPVLLVNQREDPATITAFLMRERLAGGAVVLDPTGTLGDATHARAFPTTLFVDAAGRMRAIHAGEISRAALMAGIRDLESQPN